MNILITNQTTLATPDFTVGQIAYCKVDDCVRQVKIKNVQVILDATVTSYRYSVSGTESVGYKPFAQEVWQHQLRATPNEFWTNREN